MSLRGSCASRNCRSIADPQGQRELRVGVLGAAGEELPRVDRRRPVDQQVEVLAVVELALQQVGDEQLVEGGRHRRVGVAADGPVEDGVDDRRLDVADQSLGPGQSAHRRELQLQRARRCRRREPAGWRAAAGRWRRCRPAATPRRPGRGAGWRWTRLRRPAGRPVVDVARSCRPPVARRPARRGGRGRRPAGRSGRRSARSARVGRSGRTCWPGPCPSPTAPSAGRAGRWRCSRRRPAPARNPPRSDRRPRTCRW